MKRYEFAFGSNHCEIIVFGNPERAHVYVIEANGTESRHMVDRSGEPVEFYAKSGGMDPLRRATRFLSERFGAQGPSPGQAQAVRRPVEPFEVDFEDD